MATFLTAPNNANFGQMGAALMTVGGLVTPSIGMVLTAPQQNTVTSTSRPTLGQIFPLGNFFWQAQMNQLSEVFFQTPGTFTWTVPNTVTAVELEGWGPSGGGGGSASSGFGGGGGSAGSYGRDVYPVTPGSTLTITIGTHGVGGTGAGNGTDGSGPVTVTGMTSGAFSVPAGKGGAAATGSASGAGGAAPAAPTGPTFAKAGGAGQSGYTISTFGVGGNGGSVNGATGGGTTPGASGNKGASPGGGGAGGGSAGSSANGADGQDGCLIIRMVQ